MSIEARIIRIIGIVQGVGFRPFIERLAKSIGLKGYVRNIGGSEVEIFVEGEKEKIEEFLDRIKKEKPPPAEIEEILVEKVKYVGYKDFVIKPSVSIVKEPSMIPPDIGICEQCLEEVLNPRSRWYMYPFNSCAWCGPRYSMMYRVPYDRENTSMRDFPLCEDCLAEYKDLNNIRRHHAQGISCPKCGPRIWLVDRSGDVVEDRDVINVAAKLLDEGYILSIKGLGGFHIAALATVDDVVLELRKRKRRREKPFALMALNVQIIEKFAYTSEILVKQLLSPQKPIVLLPKRDNSFISKYIAPGLHLIGVMLPYTALHYLILERTRDKVLIMTSGNPVGKPMCITNECALEKLKNIVDYHLLHNREIVNRVDDSVVRETNGRITFLRRSRGYAPKWIRLPLKFSDVVLAFGADLQTAGGILFDDKLILTQYIGDIDEFENLEFLANVLEFFMKTYDLWNRRKIVVADKHPQYASTRLALEWAEKHGGEIIRVQHHHAHVASAMVENRVKVDEKVVGIAIDGAGFGDDGFIWGGEIFVADYRDYERIGHLEYQPMPGGDRATYYPARMLVGILSNVMDYDEILELFKKYDLVRGFKFGEKELEISYKLATRRDVIKTSSMGRVLDAMASLLGICFERTYEGEPAMKLESFAYGENKWFDVGVKVKNFGNRYVIKTTELFLELLEFVDKNGKRVAYTFQKILGRTLGEIAVREAKRVGVDKVFLSGGAAVNSIISSAIEEVCIEEDIKLVIQTKFPAGDGGIAAGQAIIAALNSLDNFDI